MFVNANSVAHQVTSLHDTIICDFIINTLCSKQTIFRTNLTTRTFDMKLSTCANLLSFPLILQFYVDLHMYIIWLYRFFLVSHLTTNKTTVANAILSWSPQSNHQLFQLIQTHWTKEKKTRIKCFHTLYSIFIEYDSIWNDILNRSYQSTAWRSVSFIFFFLYWGWSDFARELFNAKQNHCDIDRIKISGKIIVHVWYN